MKRIVSIIFVLMVVVGCTGVPKPKTPDDKFRVPINLTIPVELLNNEAL